MEIKLKELFGHNMQETGREGGEINFTQFIESFEKSQLNLVRLFSIIFVFTNKIFFIKNKILDIIHLPSTSFIVLEFINLLIIQKNNCNYRS